MMHVKRLVAVMFLVVTMAPTGVFAQATRESLTKEFAKSYAQMAYLNYQESANTAAELEEDIEDFLEQPNTASLNKAKEAWKASRIPYGQSEVFRFADGPIDGTDEGPEGLLNAWPLNEAYIDYVKDNPNAGIINDKKIKIDEDMLTKKNQADDEADVTTGYHAIEFLLWGQDLSTTGPGARPALDYAKGDPIKERRREYLHEVTELLVKDLSSMVSAWAPDQDNYRKKFLAQEGNVTLTQALTSLATLSGFELSSERIATALDSGDQEDEHSCFSDNTHIDFQMNIQGIENVYYGHYDAYKGVGIDQIAKLVNPGLATKIDAQLKETHKLVMKIEPPVDQILASEKGSSQRQNLEALVKSLQKQADLFKELGTALGLKVEIRN